jgi:hypothetical protein
MVFITNGEFENKKRWSVHAAWHGLAPSLDGAIGVGYLADNVERGLRGIRFFRGKIIHRREIN